MNLDRPSLVLETNLGGVGVSICACGGLIWMSLLNEHIEACAPAQDWIVKREGDAPIVEVK